MEYIFSQIDKDDNVDRLTSLSIEVRQLQAKLREDEMEIY